MDLDVLTSVSNGVVALRARRTPFLGNIDEEKPMTTHENTHASRAKAEIEADKPAQLLVTIPQAASLLAISRSTVYELIWQQELDPIRIGRSVRLRMSDLEAFARGDNEAHSPTATETVDR
ncbi:MAG: helix-turn-helix domain-containing protein [Acidimicrobiales bacterium]